MAMRIKKADRPALSKGLMQMKFMQRTRLKQDEEEALGVQRQLQEKFLPSSSGIDKQCQFVVEDSFVTLQNLKFGRMSFRGFNPEVEKLMAHYDALEAERNAPPSVEADFDDKELTQRFLAVVDNRRITGPRHKRFRQLVEEESSGSGRPGAGFEYQIHSSVVVKSEHFQIDNEAATDFQKIDNFAAGGGEASSASAGFPAKRQKFAQQPLPLANPNKKWRRDAANLEPKKTIKREVVDVDEEETKSRYANRREFKKPKD